jgi:hypothetical protein
MLTTKKPVNAMANRPKGKVFIASMDMRGKWAEKPDVPDLLTVNVTSSQSKNSANRLAFSPMTPVPGGYKGFYNFEAYWQSGKVYQDIPKEATRNWWKNVRQPKRRYPNSKGLKVLYAMFYDVNEGIPMDYVTSRKRVYVPEYYQYIKDKDRASELRKEVDAGRNVIVYDFDGPRTASGGEISCSECSLELLTEKINDTRHPFGHGYIVAGYLMGITPEMYI